MILSRVCSIALSSALVTAAHAQITVTRPIPERATISVDTAKVANYKIPRTIFGTFLEPIGNSTYNGLWAEILVNPSLEEDLWDTKHIAGMVRDEPGLARASQLGLPLPWEPVNADQGNRYEPHWGDAANSWRSLEVIGVPGEPTGIRQKIYLPVQRVLTYKGSLYAKHLTGPTGLTIEIRRHNSEEMLATAHVDASAAGWTKYNYELSVPAGKLARLEPADFAVIVDGDERVDLDELSLNPSDAVDGMDPDVVRMAKEMHTPLLRFGGNFTSGYHWRDGIGPLDKRVSMLNIAWGIPEYNTFGTDEFLEFCKLIGAEPQIALNLGSGTPQEAAQWVRYVDNHWDDKAGGLHWELGNELWGTWNLGWPTLQQLPGRTREFSEAVRAVDPKAKLIATGADPDHYEKWDAAQLTDPAGTFNDLSTHFVVTVDKTELKHPSPEFIAGSTFALPVELGRKLQAMQQEINQHPAFADKAHVAFTEWLYVAQRPDAPRFTNMGGAIGAASFLNMLMRNAQVVPISDMTGIMEFAGIWKKRGQVYAAPAYYAFKMFAGAGATRPVGVSVDSGEYAVHNGITRLPEIADVPYLDVVAATDDSGKTLTLFVVNRHLTRDIETTIDLHGFNAGPTAQMQTLESGSLYDANDETEPEHVVPTEGTAKVNGHSVRYAFPHESVTVMTLTSK